MYYMAEKRWEKTHVIFSLMQSQWEQQKANMNFYRQKDYSRSKYPAKPQDYNLQGLPKNEPTGVQELKREQ